MAHPIGVPSSERVSKVTGAALIASLLVLEGLRAFGIRVGTVALLEIAFVMVAVRELRRTRGSASTPRLEVRIARAFESLLAPRLARLVAFELMMVGSAVRVRRVAPARPGRIRVPPHEWSALVPAGASAACSRRPASGGARDLAASIPWLRACVHAAAIYGLVWLVGLYASMRVRPHELVAGRLMLRRGLLRSVEVPAHTIESLRPVPLFGDDWKARAYYRGTIRIDVAGPAVLEMRLKVAVRANGILGAGRLCSRVIVPVDEPVAFTAAIELARAAGRGQGDLGPSA